MVFEEEQPRIRPGDKGNKIMSKAKEFKFCQMLSRYVLYLRLLSRVSMRGAFSVTLQVQLRKVLV
jgi:hypothetical protein